MGKIRISFALLLALIFTAAVFGDIPYPISLASAFLIHEGGHIIAARALGVPLQSIRGGFCGIRMKYDFSCVKPKYEIAVCMAGSFAGMFAAAIGLLIGLAYTEGGVYFIVSSSALSAVNMLPVRGLDGGSILMCILEASLLPDTAWKISKRISTVTSILFWIVSIWIQLKVGINLSMLILSLYFLYLSAYES